MSVDVKRYAWHDDGMWCMTNDPTNRYRGVTAQWVRAVDYDRLRTKLIAADAHTDDLRAQLAKFAQCEWRSIESAPKDARILVCGGTYSTGDHQDLKSDGVSVVHWYSGEWLDDAEYCGCDIYRNPTHWMPMPEAALSANPLTSATGEK